MSSTEDRLRERVQPGDPVDTLLRVQPDHACAKVPRGDGAAERWERAHGW